MADLRPLAELNTMANDEFAIALRPLFETADTLAVRLFAQRPFTSYDDVIDRAEALVQTMPPADMVAVLNAHPRIGASPAELSSLSFREQGNAAEASAQSDELQRVYAALAELNREYEARFGFRFVVFVNGRPKAAILEVLEGRIRNAPADELRTGLQEMLLIARDRLRTLSS
jgi:OHCU decarboxylase